MNFIKLQNKGDSIQIRGFLKQSAHFFAIIIPIKYSSSGSEYMIVDIFERGLHDNHLSMLLQSYN